MGHTYIGFAFIVVLKPYAEEDYENLAMLKKRVVFNIVCETGNGTLKLTPYSSIRS